MGRYTAALCNLEDITAKLRYWPPTLWGRVWAAALYFKIPNGKSGLEHAQLKRLDRFSVLY